MTSIICVPVALQRYVNPPPVARRQRDLALLIARAEGASVRVISVEAKLPLVAQALTLQQKLEDFVKPLLDAKLDVQFEVLEGRPGEVVPRFFKVNRCDLLLLGTHSKRGVLDTALGNVASSLLHEISAPVILVRPSLEEMTETKALMIPEVPWVLPYF